MYFSSNLHILTLHYTKGIKGISVILCFFLSIPSEVEFLKPNTINKKPLGNNTHLLMG